MTKNRPHIIIFNPDQWRGDVVGHLDNQAAVTPNLDQWVAEDAVSFRDAYCQNPVCTPSRCSFMTGWYPHVRGHRTMSHMLQPDEPCLLKILKEQGYFVWWGGKNDLIGEQNDPSPYRDVRYEPPASPRPMFQFDRMNEWRGEPGSDTYYSFYVGTLDTKGEAFYPDRDWANVHGAIEQIKNRPVDQPLCIFLPLTYPHPPYAVEEHFLEQIDRTKLPPRRPFPPNWEGKPSMLKGIWQNQGLQSWTEERWDDLRAIYYGMCARVDHQFGLILGALKQAGIYNETAVFFFSDHGDYTGDYGIVEKNQNTFEDCLTRVPFAVKPPSSTPTQPGIRDALVELVDFPATVYDLLEISPDYDYFGKSLLPLIAGETQEHRDAVFCEGGRRLGEWQSSERELPNAANPLYKDPTGLYWPRVSLQGDLENPAHSKAVMCRTKDFKYVYRLNEPHELYDLNRDPNEVQNQINNPAYLPILQEMRDRLLRWQVETSDVVPHDFDRRG